MDSPGLSRRETASNGRSLRLRGLLGSRDRSPSLPFSQTESIAPLSGVHFLPGTANCPAFQMCHVYFAPCFEKHLVCVYLATARRIFHFPPGPSSWMSAVRAAAGRLTYTVQRSPRLCCAESLPQILVQAQLAQSPDLSCQMAVRHFKVLEAFCRGVIQLSFFGMLAKGSHSPFV